VADYAIAIVRVRFVLVARVVVQLFLSLIDKNKLFKRLLAVSFVREKSAIRFFRGTSWNCDCESLQQFFVIFFWVTENKKGPFFSLFWPPIFITHTIYMKKRKMMNYTLQWKERLYWKKKIFSITVIMSKKVRLCISIMKKQKRRSNLLPLCV